MSIVGPSSPAAEVGHPPGRPDPHRERAAHRWRGGPSTGPRAGPVRSSHADDPRARRPVDRRHGPAPRPRQPGGARASRPDGRDPARRRSPAACPARIGPNNVVPSNPERPIDSRITASTRPRAAASRRTGGVPTVTPRPRARAVRTMSERPVHAMALPSWTIRDTTNPDAFDASSTRMVEPHDSPHPRRGRSGVQSQPPPQDPRSRRVRSGDGRRRPIGLGRAPEPQVPPGDHRPADARAERAGPARPRARRAAPGRDDRADGLRRPHRGPAGHEGRRRRLHHQAVRPRPAPVPGQADPRSPRVDR